jgi:hypothetical protein
MSGNVIITMCHPSGGGGSFFHTTSESVTTDNTTPTAANENVFVTHVTTDASGLTQIIALPTLTADKAGLMHLVYLSTLAGAGDEIQFTGTDATSQILNAQDQYCLFVWGGASWRIVLGLTSSNGYGVPVFLRMEADGSVHWRDVSVMFSGVAAGNWTFLGTDDGDVAFNFRDANDINTYDELNLSGASSVAVRQYLTYLTSGGSATTENFSIPARDGEKSGQRKLILLDTLTDPADVPTLDPANIETEAGAQPASIQITVEGDSLLLEWRQMRNGNNGKWVIIEASSGVVTP